eukprot:TRINITY_DN48_c2_g1_i1.p1 TRINITY_DN48_c2_g1~~TRINITY_DN48_c2_g1_i1.p1  ORF type:complete len:123 (-),score=39.26 TRINITY_DN48_c2_g1_i1:283-651(-)
MLSQQEFEHPDLFWSLAKTMKPLVSIDRTEKALDWFRQAMGGDGDEDDEEEIGKFANAVATASSSSAEKPNRSRGVSKAGGKEVATKPVEAPSTVTSMAVVAVVSAVSAAAVTWCYAQRRAR